MLPSESFLRRLDCGTENKELLADELYLGEKKPRISDADHAAFLEEFSLAVKDKWPRCHRERSVTVQVNWCNLILAVNVSLLPFPSTYLSGHVSIKTCVIPSTFYIASKRVLCTLHGVV